MPNLDEISIHATLTGRDDKETPFGYLHQDFNPRDPHGSRPGSRSGTPDRTDFNPRDPHGSRLNIREIGEMDIDISIHATLTGRD